MHHRMRPYGRRSLPLQLALPATLTALSLSPATHAATWINPAGGSWSTGSNWSDGGRSDPSPADFNLGATAPDFSAYPGYTIQLPAAGLSSAMLRVHSDKVTLQQPAGTTSSLYIYVAVSPATAGSLTLAGGTYAMQQFSDPSSPASATLSVSPATTVTYLGSISTGFWPGSTTTFNVAGPGALLMPSGLDLANGPGTANLNITGGGASYSESTRLSAPVILAGTARFGNGGTANVAISGQGSLLAYSTVSVGTTRAAAPSTVSLAAGGQILGDTVTLGTSGGSASLTADGAKTLLSVTRTLTLGQSTSTKSPITPSTGTASLTNGAAIAAPNADVFVGINGGSGSLSLATGSSFSAGSLDIGYSNGAHGSLSVSSGSSVNTKWGAYIGQSYGAAPTPGTTYATGAVSLGSAVPTAPSTWTANQIDVYAGSLNVATGGSVTTSVFLLHQLGTLTLAGGTLTSSFAISLYGGTLAGAGTVHAPSLSAAAPDATLAPDGALALDANLALAANAPTLAFDLTSPTTYDRLTSIHTLTFGGTLAVSLAPSYAPQLGDAFDLLDFAARSDSSTFSTLSLPPLPPGLTWDTSALYTTGTIAVTPEPAPLLTACALALPLLTRRRTNSKFCP